MADLVASWSPDRGTKCGAVIVDDEAKTVLAVGYNGFPRGISSDPDQVPERWTRDDGEKYRWVEHGERNAIYNAASTGVSIRGATMYLNYAVECCTDCTRAIIQSGIRRVVGPDRSFPGKGNGSHYNTADVSVDMMDEADIDIERIDMGMEEHEYMSHIPEDERV